MGQAKIPNVSVLVITSVLEVVQKADAITVFPQLFAGRDKVDALFVIDNVFSEIRLQLHEDWMKNVTVFVDATTDSIDATDFYQDAGYFANLVLLRDEYSYEISPGGATFLVSERGPEYPWTNISENIWEFKLEENNMPYSIFEDLYSKFPYEHLLADVRDSTFMQFMLSNCGVNQLLLAVSEQILSLALQNELLTPFCKVITEEESDEEECRNHLRFTFQGKEKIHNTRMSLLRYSVRYIPIL